VADTACADIWTRLALIDTRNSTTLISPSASISAFNLDLQLGQGAPDRGRIITAPRRALEISRISESRGARPRDLSRHLCSVTSDRSKTSEF